MRKRNYAVILSLILTLFCCSLTGFAASTSTDGPPVSMEVSSIYGDIGKLGVHVPLSVSLYGQTEETFRGTLAVQTLENGAEEGEEIYEYQYPVEIATAETKVLEIYIPLGQRSSEIHVILKDESGNAVLSQTKRFEISRDMGRLLIGVLSERAESISYLDGVSLDYGMVQSKTIVMNEETLPADEKGLELLDMLVISHYETDRLSDEQIQAVNAWVEEGGTLLFGTGAMVYSVLGNFAEDLVELPIGGIFYENVNLGTEYAEKAPGDAEVNMACAELVIPDGIVVEESDGIPLLTMVKRGSGQIGICTYDLDEITDFVEKNPGYVVRMLTNVLGEDRISMLYYYSSYGEDEDYWNAYTLVNSGSADRLPNLGLYTLVILIYIAVVGPGLYLFLKKKDMSRIYGTAVVVSAIGISAVIYLMGVGTRFTSQFFSVASIVDMDEKMMRETSYLNVRTPDSRPFSVAIPSSYEVTALTRTSRYNEQAISEFDQSKEGSVELHMGENGTVISARKSKAFEPRFFKLTREDARSAERMITGNLQWYDGKISGTVENRMPFTLEDAALVLYGQMYLIGDMAPGEVLEFEEEELLVWPVGMSYVAAAAVTGRDKTEDTTDSEYLESVERSSLYAYYLGSEFYDYTPEACLVAIGPSGGILSDPAIKDHAADGSVLYSARLNVSSGEEDLVYRSIMKYDPEVTIGNGAVYGDGLTMYGTEPLAMEYFLGDGMGIERISILPVSEAFLDNPDYYYLKRFDGAAYLYNQTTRSYDWIDLSQIHFTAEELRPYISQENSIVVKYTVGDSETSGKTMLLPHLMVTGREG